MLCGALALWLGGLTFYALVVIPIGTARLGSLEQGFITRDVTVRLNYIATGVLTALLIDVVHARNWRLYVLWNILLLCQIGLFLIHHWLRSLINTEDRLVTDEAFFYHLHRVYLLVTAVQWLFGWVYYSILVARVPNKANNIHVR